MPENLIRNKFPFFFTWGFLVIAMGALILLYPKPGSFMLLNSFHSKGLDYLFLLLTPLGDGRFVIILVLVLFFLRQRAMSLLILGSFLISGLVAQLIKAVVAVPRPAMYFQLNAIAYDDFLPGVTLHNFHSFPSGHTATAFAVAASVAFLIKNKNAGFLTAIFAFLIAYSRVYLGQHFPEDIEAGMFLGTLGAVFCLKVFGSYFFKWERALNGQR